MSEVSKEESFEYRLEFLGSVDRCEVTCGSYGDKFIQWTDGGPFVEYQDHLNRVELYATELDAQRLRADTAEAELAKFDEGMRAIACSLGAGGYNAESLTGDQLVAKVQWGIDELLDVHERRMTTAEQRIASIVGKPAKCKECGSDALFWFDSNTNTSGIMEGRLRTNEVTCTFVLGCADCSATIKTVRAETIAARMTAALNPNPEAESHE